jgi:hypothetical protein
MDARVRTKQKKFGTLPVPAAGGGILQRKCACGQHTTDQYGQCAECRKKHMGLQRRAVNQNGPEIAPPIVHEVLRSPEQMLDPPSRACVEPRFYQDFSRVSMHYAPSQVVQSRLAISQISDTSEREASQHSSSVARLPTLLKAGLEALSGLDLSGVRVHYHSLGPAQFNALAYTQGQEIHIAPGQERHLPHEGWHAVQQMRGQVKRTAQVRGVALNDDRGLEQEADVMGAKALQLNAFADGKHLLRSKLLYGIRTPMAQSAIQRKVNCSSTYAGAKKSSVVKEKYELIGLGEIIPWSAAMHPVPPQFKKVPHDNTCEDITRGTKVIILGNNSDWIYVHTLGNSGFISKELIKYEITPEVAAPSFIESLKRLRAAAKSVIGLRTFVETEREAVMINIVEADKKWNLQVLPSSLHIRFKQVKDAFLILKKTENKPASLNDAEQILVEIATEQLNDTGKYDIDPDTKKVTFKTTPGTQVRIDSIEDFILFVEKVEDTYPSSSVKDIASEIRQIWFSDVNWEILVASTGITDSSGKFVDIETKPNVIATMFDMKDLAPDGKEKVISSPLGNIAISHVIAGIDAYLSGAPSLADALSHVKKQGRSTKDVELKHKTLTAQHGGDPTDFATWSGDLGQAYAEYLVNKYVKGNGAAKLNSFMNDKAPDSQLLADIHGYIAVKVWTKIPEADTPSGAEKKLSDILRDLYLVNKTGITSQSHSNQIPRSYRSYFEEITGKAGNALRDYIKDRSLNFGAPWYAKKAVDHRGFWGSEGWSKETILRNSINEFHKRHQENDSGASTEDKLDFYVNRFVKLLNEKMQ